MILTRRAMLGAATAAGLTARFARATQAPTEALSPAAMRADLDLLRHAYETVHPGLDRYLGRAAFRARIDAAKGWANRERSLAEMFVTLARLTAAVRCGHTYPNPHNQRRAVRAALFEGRDRLPLAFRWIGERMIVTGGRGRPSPVPVGSAILSVDGIPAARLLGSLFPLARADGGNDAKRRAQLGLDPRERFAAFDLYRAALFPARSGEIALLVRTPGGDERDISVPALTEQELPAGGENARPSELGWRFDIDAQGIGRLTMPDWVTYHTQWNWRGFIDAAVDRLIDERARGLIVDLRGNEGGTECGWHMLERLVARDTDLPRFARRVRYRALPADLRAPLDTWDDSFRHWGAAAEGPAHDGFYNLNRPDAEVDVIRPRGRRYAGPVAVLADATCSSATYQFANAVKATNAAWLVGETTGGNRRGINGGAYFFVRLPGSGLEVDLPIVGIFAQGRQPDEGVTPHIPVPLTAEDIARAIDRPMLVATRRLLGN